jgi:hypothetical protein
MLLALPSRRLAATKQLGFRPRNLRNTHYRHGFGQGRGTFDSI